MMNKLPDVVMRWISHNQSMIVMTNFISVNCG